MPELSRDPGHGQNYWRSLRELADSDEFRRQLDDEFPAGIALAGDGLSRRRFMQIMAASAALASLTGCRWPEQTIVPLSHRPPGTTPGVAKQFATAMELAGVARPLVATSYDGRPIKIDGNQEHPLASGAADLFAQASVLDLYDPDRSRRVVQHRNHQRVGSSWDDFAAFAAQHFGTLAGAGERFAVLAEASSSPSRARLQAALKEKFPRSRWYEHEPLSDRTVRDGAALAFGRPYRPMYDLAQADVIVCLDADLLQSDPTALRNARQFAAGRRPETGRMNRLYVYENSPTVTGGMADHRFVSALAAIPLVAACLAAELFLEHDLELPSGSGIGRAELQPFAHHPERPSSVGAVARDLLAHRGRGLVVAGPRQPAEVHALCHLVNAALGNAGHSVAYHPVAAAETEAGDCAELTARLHAGEVDTLLILGGNPAYSAPADLDFATALDRVATAIHLSDKLDATSARCRWHINRAHYLESWGDLRAADGSYLTVQPLIEPLYGGKTDLDLLALLVEPTGRTGYDVVRATYHRLGGGSGAPGDDAGFERQWRKTLHDGFAVANTGNAPPPRLAGRPLRLDPDHHAPGPDGLELVFAADGSLLDGRFADNAWLQELPDFLTKLTWDNAALMAPATAAALGVGQGDLIELTWRQRALTVPVYVLPGQAAWSVTLNLGYGREDAGRVGQHVGCNAYRLRTADAPWGGIGAQAQRTGGRHLLACTQEHHAIDTRGAKERADRVPRLIRETDLAHYVENPDFAQHEGIHHPPLISLWREKEYTGHAWGMSIDLAACIGCNACIVACQAENNIPVVGKKQVAKGREMHWIRLDRYFKGDQSEPEFAHQPVACAHCELAPCEGVCPVAATTHSREGLNTMAYNRCVGTRYCANNCPYKVRRFNWFNFQDDVPAPRQMVYNPEVTVRARGVMEKCTYCVQRIESARIDASNRREPLRDGDIVPACQQTCPTEAIVFGDLNDAASRVAALRENSRAYDMLAYLNIKPRTSYLARVRNPNPELAAPGRGGGGHDSGHDNGHAGGAQGSSDQEHGRG